MLGVSNHELDELAGCFWSKFGCVFLVAVPLPAVRFVNFVAGVFDCGFSVAFVFVGVLPAREEPLEEVALVVFVVARNYVTVWFDAFTREFGYGGNGSSGV